MSCYTKVFFSAAKLCDTLLLLQVLQTREKKSYMCRYIIKQLVHVWRELLPCVISHIVGELCLNCTMLSHPTMMTSFVSEPKN